MERSIIVSLVLAQFLSTTVVIGNQGIAQDFLTVYPQVFESRQDSSEKVVFITDGYMLNIRKASVLAERILLRDVTEDGIIERYVQGAYYERHLFEDSNSQASLLLQPQGPSGYIIKGLLNFTHQIEPVMSSERSSSSSRAHKISMIPTRSGSCGTEDVAIENTPQEAEARKGDAKRPNYVLELYFLSDYNHTVYFNNETEDRVAYVTVFMHSVSLRLGQLDPPISVVMTAIQGSFTYNESYVDLYTEGELIGSSSLDKLERHFDNDPLMKKADIVFMATGRELIRLVKGGKSSTLAGLASFGKACKPQKGTVGEDKPGTFSGVHIAAHEIGHQLGANHDGQKPAENCSSSDGYIMSKYAKGKRMMTFSECTKKSIADFLTRPDSSCLKSRKSCRIISMPNEAVMLAGDFIDGDAYCKKYYQKYKQVTYIKEESDLSQCRFRCLLGPENGKEAQNVTAFAMDGTRCSRSDPKKVCKNSICQ
uniref:Peptidase M12B domain-containing protein n=1 Tax=Amblyomma maculatum TaxID=34609 RepID=G3MPX7_AMBMU